MSFALFSDSVAYEPIASLFPLDLSGDVMALRACIDAGTQEGVFCVAAVAFGYDRAVKANREWERLLKGRTFHMTDLNARKEDFEGIEDDEVDAIMKGTVRIIRKYASYAVAVSCDRSLVADNLPVVAQKVPDMQHMLSAIKSNYGFMCHFAMTGLGGRANLGREIGRHISYVFERGDEGQRGLRKYLEYLGDEDHHQLLLNSYSFNRMTVTDKEELEGIFHAADLLAWEWARHVVRHKQGLPMRLSLAALADNGEVKPTKYGIGLDNERMLFRHFSDERMEAVTAVFRGMMETETAEGVEAAMRRYREATGSQA